MCAQGGLCARFERIVELPGRRERYGRVRGALCGVRGVIKPSSCGTYYWADTVFVSRLRRDIRASDVCGMRRHCGAALRGRHYRDRTRSRRRRGSDGRRLWGIPGALRDARRGGCEAEGRGADGARGDCGRTRGRRKGGLGRGGWRRTAHRGDIDLSYGRVVRADRSDGLKFAGLLVVRRVPRAGRGLDARHDEGWRHIRLFDGLRLRGVG